MTVSTVKKLQASKLAASRRRNAGQLTARRTEDDNRRVLAVLALLGR